MKINDSKKPKFSIKNVYVNRMYKPKKQNIQNKINSNNGKNSQDNKNNQSINFNSKIIFFNKKTKKTLYEKFYPNKSLIRGQEYFASQKKIHNNTNLNRNEKSLSLGVFTNFTISGRKLGQKRYEIINPLKERSNSENKINSFNRTYTFFNNKNNNQKSYSKTNQNYRKQERKKIEKISINLSDIEYQNIPNNSYNFSASNLNNIYNNKKSISPIQSTNNRKKNIYSEKNHKNDFQDEKNISYTKLHKKAINSIMTPKSHKNFSNSNIISPNNNNNNKLKIKNDKNGRIKKYILNNLSDKRNCQSRQCFRQYLEGPFKSSDIKKGKIINNQNYLNYNSPLSKKCESKGIENVSILNSPTIPSISSIVEENNNSLKINKKYICNNKKINYKNNINIYKNNNKNKLKKNILPLRNDINLNLTSKGFFSDYEKKRKEIKEKEIFEISAIFIQSVFRGYLVKSRLESFLYKYKFYNKGFEILEKIFASLLDKRINIKEEKKIFMNYLMILKKDIFSKTNININNKSCKTFKLINFPNSPLSDKDIRKSRHYEDLYLHKEIGERFNIIKQNKEKELEKKYKEELDGINNKMSLLIEENNKLKDINQKNKYKENKYKELSKDNKKKENIINIITNDNQNLAKQLKIIKDKNNKLTIHNQGNINYLNESNNLFNKYKDLFTDYRHLYLFFIIYKKKVHLLDILRKYFDKFKNITTEISNNNKINILLREQKLIYLIKNKRNKEYIFLKNNFSKFYFRGLMNNKEKENITSIIKEKLKNIIYNKEKKRKFLFKSYLYKFYYKGMISDLNNDKNEYILEKKKADKEKIKHLFISMEHRTNKHNFLIIRDCFDKWNLFSKILGMKAITDEKKRKKRQKQRMKKKIENKSVNNNYFTNNNITHLEKNNNINVINKEKEKDKYTIICSEHSITTDFSGGDINGENKIDKIMKASEKLGELFYKATMNYKSLENKKKDINSNKEINYKGNQKIKQSDKKIKQNNEDNNENNNESDEDSGDSFGI